MKTISTILSKDIAHYVVMGVIISCSHLIMAIELEDIFNKKTLGDIIQQF